MRTPLFALAAGLFLGLVAGACGSFDKALVEFCNSPGSGGSCSCDGGHCCINDGFMAETDKQCCPGLNHRVVDGGSGVQCCSQNGCLGPDGGPQPDGGPGDGGPLGSACTVWQDCYHNGNGGLSCTAAGAGSTCQDRACWLESDGGSGGCGHQNDNSGLVNLNGGGQGSCGLPGYRGPIPCCFDRCPNGSLCSCLATGHCTCVASGVCTSTDTTYTCPP